MPASGVMSGARRSTALAVAALLVIGACSSGATAAPSVGGAAASTAPGGVAGASAGAAGSAGAVASQPAASTGTTGSFDASSVSGNITLAGWSAAGSTELNALQKVLNQFEAKYPKIKVTFQPVAGDYPSAMVAKFSARQPPDLFYVDSSVAPDWINQGVLYPLDDWISSRGFDTSQFFPGFLNAFKGPDGKIYGIPKDGNALGMAYNTDLLSKAGISSPPATLDDLTADAAKLKSSGVSTPLCLSQTLDRSLAFIYAEGGSLLSSDLKTEQIDQPASVQGITYYLNLFKQGYGQGPSALGVDWCGKALGEGKVAIIFEGSWLDPFMSSTYPAIKYAWAPIPKGTQQATLGFTVSYSIGKDSPNKDAAWVLLTYLTGQQGMTEWVAGGVALPSRKDVAPPAADKVLVDAASYAHPWSFIPGFSKVSDTFNNALTAAIQGGGSANDVVSKTKSALETALSGQ